MIFGLVVIVKLVRLVIADKVPIAVGSTPANDGVTSPPRAKATMWLFPVPQVIPFHLRGQEGFQGVVASVDINRMGRK